MVKKPRSFKELGVLPCSYQSQIERYPLLEDDRPPPIAHYRNNLTALSQYWNLFFVAYIDQIHVYKPQFPTQKISSKPELVIDLPRTRPNRSGHISHSKPHAANNLAVGDLGHEEVIVAVCDDGDVIAYTTRSIHEAIESDMIDDEEGQINTATAKRILLRNVGKSAWGIAIHKVARLIAVSANTHIITVFAFALHREPSHYKPGVSEDREVLPDASKLDDDGPFQDLCEDQDALQEAQNIQLPYGPNEWVSAAPFSHLILLRSRYNLEITLEGHDNNIPDIAFCNTTADPAGRYLVSTDLNGETFVWDIWRRKVLADLTSHHNPFSRFKPYKNQPEDGLAPRAASELGWCVACLDPQSFRYNNTIEGMYGCPKISDHIGNIYCGKSRSFPTTGIIVDNTPSKELVPDSSTYHPSYARPKTAPPLSNMDPNNLILTEDEDSEDEDSGDDGIQGEPGGAVSNSESGAGFASSELSAIAALVTMAQQPSNQQFNAPNTQPTLMDLDEPPWNWHQARKVPNDPRTYILPFNVFHSERFDLHLLTEIQYGRDSTTCNIVKCQQPLRQEIPSRFRQLLYYDRLKMLIQIPELGVVAIATQVGRVALLTMTSMGGAGVTKHGFRIEWFLPFKSQEERGRRPNCSLLGMAVGPLQGFEAASSCSNSFNSPGRRNFSGKGPINGVKGSRRFRLILFYYDHSILTYEIWRNAEESKPGIRAIDLALAC